MPVEIEGAMPFGPYDAKSCGAVVFRLDGDTPVYLLLHYAAGHWDLVKGHSEAGETEEETTRRECVEETGIRDLRFHPGFRRTIRYTYTHEGRRVTKLVAFRLALTATEQVVISHEHRGHAWLRHPEARTRLTYDNAREVLDAAHAVVQQDLRGLDADSPA